MIKVRFLFAILGALSLSVLSLCTEDEIPLKIFSIEPLSGDYGDEVTIRGESLGSNPRVYFTSMDSYGAPANVDVVSDNEIVVKVPANATNGPINVSTDSYFKGVQSKDEFTITGGTWVKKGDFSVSASSLTSRSFSIGGNGYVYTLGSPEFLAKLSMYNSATNTWSDQTELNFNIQHGSSGSTKMWGTSDKGYVLYYNELWEFDPINSNWTKKNALPAGINGNTVRLVLYLKEANKCYVIAGGALYLYDHVNDGWSYIQPFTFFAGASRYIAASGISKSYFMADEKLWSLDPEFSLWKEEADFPENSYANYAFCIDNDFYVGYSGENKFWVYKSVTKKWTRKSGLINPYRDSPIYFTLSNKCYLGLGISYASSVNGSYARDMFEYNP